MNQYIFTPEGIEALHRVIRDTKKRLDEATKLKGEAGGEQDAWHDEGHKLGLVEEMQWSKRLGELQKMLHNAQVVKPEEQDRCVKIGTGVTIEYEDGSTLSFILDGYLVSGDLKRRVSVHSPLGKAVLGAVRSEERTLLLEKKSRIITIKEIFPPSQAEDVFKNAPKNEP